MTKHTAHTGEYVKFFQVSCMYFFFNFLIKIRGKINIKVANTC